MKRIKEIKHITEMKINHLKEIKLIVLDVDGVESGNIPDSPGKAHAPFSFMDEFIF